MKNKITGSGKSIFSAVLWIAVYILSVSIGSVISEIIKINYSGEVIILTAFSLILLCYITKIEKKEYYGIKKLSAVNFKGVLFYIPLIFVIIANFNGLDSRIKVYEYILIAVFMLNVAFAEELIFRGIFFKTVRERSGAVKAVIISGITFGLGHIVNLFNGYTGIEQIQQIIVALLIGTVLALLFEITGTIIPGVLFHFLFNIIGEISLKNDIEYFVNLSIIIIISIGYGVYLFNYYFRRIQKRNK